MCAVLCTTDLTLDISMEMHKENRQRVLEYLRANNDLPAKTMVVVQGGEAPTFHDTGMQALATCVQPATRRLMSCMHRCAHACLRCAWWRADHEPLFKQESNFQYLFGVKEPDFYGAIDVDTGRHALYCPCAPSHHVRTGAYGCAPVQVHAVLPAPPGGVRYLDGQDSGPGRVQGHVRGVSSLWRCRCGCTCTCA